MKVVHFEKEAVTVVRHQILGRAFEAPVLSQILFLNFDSKSCASPFPRQEEGSEGAPQTLAEVYLSHLSAGEQEQARAMLQPFAEMRSWKLGHFRKTEHRIDLTPGARRYSHTLAERVRSAAT